MTAHRSAANAALFSDLLGGATDGIDTGSASPPTSPPGAPLERPEFLTERDLAALWGVSARQVRMLVTERVIEKRSGRFNYSECTRRYIERLIYQASRRGGSDPELRAERLRVQRETADKLAMANAQSRRELVSVQEVEATWAGILRSVRAGMLAVPTRAAAKLNLSAHDLDVIDREIRDALSEVGTS